MKPIKTKIENVSQTGLTTELALREIGTGIFISGGILRLGMNRQAAYDLYAAVTKKKDPRGDPAELLGSLKGKKLIISIK